MMLYRALIKTHHMTSRKKITAITKAAKKCNCAVYLKSGVHPPGVMVGECGGEQGELDLKEWVGSVKRLRYKDYKLLCSETVEQGRLLVKSGDVKEFHSMKALAHDLGECEILDWWSFHMGFTKGDG
ncbi:hypothetical protein HO173_001044 [Letharia columbiana]|uniref:Uncharacterized protein n=1 Tax=Letharia columbiana TaxID=112416 RepID=A0A8H6LA75_9LECA|nr:uncharacterized protein HO173_001044 [Letharia columbiana]KAF6241249.1 hypothetical protein HO173_001044 [Letharia columbiana]